MSNMNIQDSQIKASSSKYPDNPPENARRGRAGWCAEVSLYFHQHILSNIYTSVSYVPRVTG